MRRILLLSALLLCASARAATGDVLAVRISGTSPLNGWVAEVDIDNLATGGTYNFNLGTNNDPSAAYFVLTVTSPTYVQNSTSTSTTTRTVYGTPSLVARGQRKAYPNSSTADESTSGATLTIKVDLSDYIYSGDTVTAAIHSGFYTNGTASATYSGSVTNNSTISWSASKVIADFVVEDYRPVNGNALIEVFAAHKYAKNGNPVAGVYITATGGSSSHVESGWATLGLSAHGDKLPVYAITLDLSTSAGFTRGEVVTINFTAYPWIGGSAAVLDSTTDAGTKLYALAPLHWTIMTKMIAVVDWTGGGTPAASTSQATADAAPFATIAAAITGIAAANNSAYSLNRLDGGEVQLKAKSNITWTKSGSEVTTNGYVTFAPHSSTTRAGVIFTAGATAYNFYKYHRFYNISIARASSGYFGFNSANQQLVMELVDFNDTYSAWYDGDGNNNLDFIDCTSNNTYFFSPAASTFHSRLNRNCTSTATTERAGTLVGNASVVVTMRATGGSNGFSTLNSSGSLANIIYGYNTALAINGGYAFLNGGPVAPSNLAIVGNIIERLGSSATPLAELSDASMTNLLIAHNTFTGQRVNIENDISAAYVDKTATGYSMKFNIFNARGNHQADVYDSTAGMTGAWAFDNSVGSTTNWNEAIAYSGQQDQYGINSNTPALGFIAYTGTFPAGYVSDKSYGGTNAGNGDYRLAVGAAARAIKIPSGEAMFPYDLAGNPIPNGGTGLVGALQDTPSSGNFWWAFP